jgi:tRNA(Ile)-lysidine synthase
MSDLADRVGREVGRQAVFLPGERVLAAVSGGPDSLALLAILRELVPRLGLHLAVAHFDHGWRADSAEDARFTAAVARDWGLSCLLGGAPEPVDQVDQSEDAARRARYAFLRRAARETGSAVIALGHTRDDQVETLLLHLLRGSGSHGLSAMRPRSGDLARPLLGVSRAEIEVYLRQQGLEPRRDPSNADLRYRRNRLRRLVIPALDAFDPAARRLLARAAEILAEEDRLLEDEAARLDPGVLDDSRALRSIPVALQRRLLRRLHPELSFAQIESLRARPVGAQRARASTPSEATPGSLPAPGRALSAEPCGCDPSSFRARDPAGHVDGDTLALPLEITTRRPGDRIQPLGFPHSKLLQDVLVDAHVPRHLRHSLPIVRDQRGIVWIPGVTVAEGHRVTPVTRRQIHLQIVPSRISDATVTNP